jgi:hypothetical protein
MMMDEWWDFSARGDRRARFSSRLTNRLSSGVPALRVINSLLVSLTLSVLLPAVKSS